MFPDMAEILKCIYPALFYFEKGSGTQRVTKNSVPLF
jgi:hypothetical protein